MIHFLIILNYYLPTIPSSNPSGGKQIVLAFPIPYSWFFSSQYILSVFPALVRGGHFLFIAWLRCVYPLAEFAAFGGSCVASLVSALVLVTTKNEFESYFYQTSL